MCQRCLCTCVNHVSSLYTAAKKSRQKKAAHTASPCSYPRALNVPTLHTAAHWFAFVANAFNARLTRFKFVCTERRQRTACAAQVANSV